MLYRDYRPTQYDTKGLGLPDRQDWLVAPVGRTRDSEALQESNFRVALRRLGGESDTAEVHRFSHWGPGWFEIILVHPDRAKEVESLEIQLADYPVLDECDYSELAEEYGENDDS